MTEEIAQAFSTVGQGDREWPEVGSREIAATVTKDIVIGLLEVWPVSAPADVGWISTESMSPARLDESSQGAALRPIRVAFLRTDSGDARRGSPGGSASI